MFIDRRMNEGYPVDGSWLQPTMRILVRLNRQEDFGAKSGWLDRFKKAYKIRSLARTNQHSKTIAERLPRIQAFHSYMQEELFGVDGLLRGLSPEAIFYFDETPMALSGSGKRTLSPSGYGYVPKASGASDKRPITFTVCIAAEVEDGGPQPVKPAVVLRGKGLRLPEEEKATWARLGNHVQVYYQPKAWASSAVCLAWLEQFDLDTRHIARKHGIRVLGFDGLPGHLCVAFKRRAEQLGIFLVCVPPDCTDVLAPVDHHVALTCKRLVKKLYLMDLEAHWIRWSRGSEEGGFTDSQKRIKLTEWTAAAWAVMNDDTAYQHLFRQSFVSTGWYPLDPNGSQDGLIKVPGCPNYSFR